LESTHQWSTTAKRKGMLPPHLAGKLQGDQLITGDGSELSLPGEPLMSNTAVLPHSTITYGLTEEKTLRLWIFLIMSYFYRAYITLKHQDIPTREILKGLRVCVNYDYLFSIVEEWRSSCHIIFLKLLYFNLQFTIKMQYMLSISSQLSKCGTDPVSQLSYIHWSIFCLVSPSANF
jgi:hypothetical protein